MSEQTNHNDTQVSEDVASKSKNATGTGAANVKAGIKINSRTASDLEKVIDTIADELSLLAHPRDREDVKEKLLQILLTLFSINSLGEYARGLTAHDGNLYRFEEYQIHQTFQPFVLGSKVVVADVGTAIDFLDLSKYKFKTKYDVMTPGEMASKFKWLGSKLRKPVNLVQLSRPQVSLLAEVATFAVRGNKVVDRNQASIVFLKAKFDDEQTVSITEWARMKAISLFE